MLTQNEKQIRADRREMADILRSVEMMERNDTPQEKLASLVSRAVDAWDEWMIDYPGGVKFVQERGPEYEALKVQACAHLLACLDAK